MENPLLTTIREYLTEQAIPFREIAHAPTPTSVDSAKARGDDLRVGGKALVIKVGDEFQILVLSAALRLDSAAVRAYFGGRKFRFATPEELEAMGLQPGAIPPFGPPILPLPLHADPSVFDNSVIAFNAGTLTNSITLGVEDYRRLARPRVFRFAKSTEHDES